jgi:toxin YoeB
VKLIFSERAWSEYLHWQAEDAKLLDRVNGLLKECLRDPFRGTGKPEPLGGTLAGWWSRRIDREHRLVYRVSGKGEGQALEVAACRYHY